MEDTFQGLPEVAKNRFSNKTKGQLGWVYSYGLLDRFIL